MPLTVAQRAKLARIINADIDLRQMTGEDKIRELLRLLVLPTTAQVAAVRDAITRVRAYIQTQRDDAPDNRLAQDEAWNNDLNTLTELDANL